MAQDITAVFNAITAPFDAAVAGVAAKLMALNKVKAAPTITLNGLPQVEGWLDDIAMQLETLNRTTAQPGVTLKGADLVILKSDMLTQQLKDFAKPWTADVEVNGVSLAITKLATLKAFLASTFGKGAVTGQIGSLGTEKLLQQVGLTPEELALLGALGGDGGQQQGSGGGGGGILGLLGIGATGAAAAGAANGWLALMHVMHLFTPEIIGVLSATAALVIGFGALGIASIGAATDIIKGQQAVSAAQNAIAAAIPGTTQWQAGVVQLGQAWSGIPAILQPAVNAINNMLQGMGTSPMATEIQRFLGGQAVTIGALFSKGGNVFAPLIYAAQRALVTVEGIFSHMAGSGALTRFVDTMAKMVGPAAVEFAQLFIAIVQIAGAFAKAVTDGQGMEVIVNLFQTLAQLLSSNFMQGFIAGWVDFDRVVSVVIGLLLHVIEGVTQFGNSAHGLGTVLGFLASALLLVKGATFLLENYLGVKGAQSITLFGTSLKGLALSLVGVGLLAVGFTGLVSGVTQLLHVGNPLTALWNGIAGALGWVSKAGTSSISTINGYRLALSGAIPVTANISAAMDLLVRSEQNIGSSLVSAMTGFATFTAAAPESVARMLANLNAQNQDIAKWAADAQILIRRGMDPSAVAALAQQAPQDLATMAKATTSQLQAMSVQWDEKMMLASMSGRNGVNALTANIINGLKSNSPAMIAAAEALAKQLGLTLGDPFTTGKWSQGALAAAMHAHFNMPSPAVVSMESIEKNLNQTPVEVLKELNGQITMLDTNFQKATSSIGNYAKAEKQSMGQIVLNMGTSVAMMIGGLAMLRGTFIATWATAVASAIKSVAIFVATNVAGAATAAAGWIVANAAMTAGIALVVIVVVAAIYLIVTHWKLVVSVAKAVWHDIVVAVMDAVKQIESWIGDVVNWIKGHWQLLLAILTGPFGLLVIFVTSHIKDIKGFLSGFVKDLPGIWNAVKDLLTAPFRAAESVISGIVNQVKSWIGDITGALGGIFGGGSGSSGTRPPIPMRAGGGPVSAGQMYVVGENGPELFMANTSGTIVPNGAGGLNFSPQIIIQGDASPATVRLIQAALQQFRSQLASELGAA